MSRSITPAPSGSLSPDFITVPSSTGFSAGDYVYQKDGDFGVPPAGTLASFNISPVSSVFGSTVGGTSTPVLYYGSTSNAGGSVGQCAAKLTDGNIVIGYRRAVTPGVCFKIVDVNNVTVVAETLVVLATVSLAGPIGVIALSGGGFVIHFDNAGTAKPAFAIYTNAGAVTTAFTIDTTFPTTMVARQPISGCALPNGGFALAVVAAGLANAYLRSYSATGVGNYGWVTCGVTTGNASPVGLAARSDSTVCVAYISTATSYNYGIYNTGGGTIATGTTATSSSPYQCSVACLTNDTFVIGFSNDSATLAPRFHLLPIGNVLSSSFAVPTTNVPIGGGVSGNTWNLQIKELSSGGFVYFLGDANGASYYVFYSAAGVAAYSIPKLCPNISFYNTPAFFMGMVEITGYLSLYSGGTAPTGNNAQLELYNTKLDLTTYLPYSAITTSSPVGSATAAVGAYARSTSLPMKAAYLAANTETLTLNATVSTGSSYVVAPATISTDTVDSIKSATLPDGRFVIAYKNVTTQAVSFNVYSITGVLQTTVAVGTGTGTAKVRIAALPNGKVVVAYSTTSTTLTVAVYSSSFAFISSTNIINTSSSALFDVAGLSNNRIAVAYQMSAQYPDINIYDDALASLVTIGSLIVATTLSSINVIGSSTGGVWLKYTNTGTNPDNHHFYWANSTGNTYTVIMNNAGLGGTVNTAAPCGFAVDSANRALSFSVTAATTAFFTQLSVNNANTGIASATPATFSTNTMAGTSNVAVGVTGAGTFVCFSEGNGTFNLAGFTGTATLANIATSTPNGLLTGITKSATYGMQACITPSYGYNAVIAWINSANVAQYAIVNAYPFATTQAITAGVTGSAPTTPLNISQSSGYYLAGVAVSDCPAGGTGQIQTNGVANLNSQYSTSTAFQGFDFQNPVTVGVKGTAVGRTVTMIKD